MSDRETRKSVGRRRSRFARSLAAAGQLLLVVVVFASLALLTLSLTGSSLPIPVWLAERIEARVNAGLEVGRVELGKTSLAFGWGQSPQVLLDGIGIFDGDDARILRMEEIRTRLAARRLLQGIVAPDDIRISSVDVNVARDREGGFSVSVATGAAEGSFPGALGGLGRMLDIGPLAELSSLVVDNLAITVRDEPANRIWRSANGEFSMRRATDGLELKMTAAFPGDAGQSISTMVTLRTSPTARRGSVTASVRDALAADIVDWFPELSVLDAVDAPVSGTLTANLGDHGEITDVAGKLSVGQGQLRTARDAPPIGFEGCEIEISYETDMRTLTFNRIEMRSDPLTAAAEGTAILREARDRESAAIVGQLSLAGVSLGGRHLDTPPLNFEAGSVDFRVGFAPLRIDVGQMTLGDAGWRMNGRGGAIASDIGWDVALDVGIDTLPLDRLQALWPASVAPEIREWVANNVVEGEISDLGGFIRMPAGQSPKVALSGYFGGVGTRPSGTIPSVEGIGGYMSLLDGSYTLAIEKGLIVPPLGGDIVIDGSVLAIEDVFAKDRRAEITVFTDSTITSVLSLLDLPPLELLDGADLDADLAEGRAVLTARATFDNVGMELSAVPSFEITGQLLDTVSDTLVRNRRLEAKVLEVRADADGIEIGGSGNLGQVPVDAIWSQGFGPGNKGRSRVAGTAELSQVFLDEFGIGLPPGSVSDAGTARIIVDMQGDGSPMFRLDSDLYGIGLNIKALGWSKSPDQAGTLRVAGRLGELAAVERLEISAPGLEATGSVEFASGLRLREARFDRVAVGDWLDARATLTGMGVGLPPAVAIDGGTVDIRSARLNPGDDVGGPLKVALDRLVVSEQVALTDLRGEFVTGRGLEGDFTARVNDGPAVSGALQSGQSGMSVRIVSDQAGAVLAELGLFRNARGGSMELALTQAGEKNVYDGRMNAANVSIIEAPVMAELLNSISIVGLLDRLATGSITMSRIEAEFRLGPGSLTLYPSSAVGPSLGISLEGVHDSKNNMLDMQGVISPVYFLNAVGQLFTRGGEGLFGFIFRLKGDSRNPRVSVNPMSILTPGMFREIFRRPPPTGR